MGDYLRSVGEIVSSSVNKNLESDKIEKIEKIENDKVERELIDEMAR